MIKNIPLFFVATLPLICIASEGPPIAEIENLQIEWSHGDGKIFANDRMQAGALVSFDIPDGSILNNGYHAAFGLREYQTSDNISSEVKFSLTENRYSHLVTNKKKNKIPKNDKSVSIVYFNDDEKLLSLELNKESEHQTVDYWITSNKENNTYQLCPVIYAVNDVDPFDMFEIGDTCTGSAQNKDHVELATIAPTRYTESDFDIHSEEPYHKNYAITKHRMKFFYVDEYSERSKNLVYKDTPTYTSSDGYVSAWQSDPSLLVNTNESTWDSLTYLHYPTDKTSQVIKHLDTSNYWSSPISHQSTTLSTPAKRLINVVGVYYWNDGFMAKGYLCVEKPSYYRCGHPTTGSSLYQYNSMSRFTKNTGYVDLYDYWGNQATFIYENANKDFDSLKIGLIK